MCGPLIRRRAQRFFNSASGALLLVGPATLSAAIAIFLKPPDSKIEIPLWVLGAAVLAFILLLIQAAAEYQRRTYDLTWIFKYDERFSSKEIKEHRVLAATTIKKHQKSLRRVDTDLDDIDDVLDFFDELGFNEQGGQISPEVLHQNFHYWIRGYYSATKEYIEAWREKQPSRWEYVEELYKITDAVALERDGGKPRGLLTAPELEQFLNEEMKLTTN
ncbi:MAG TPA: hypothetical protein VHX99_04180 [Rhizomicrobium sp.]|jgi:hypothetical protein|nr:hypothetical protein [Rhizomicrobium sp.]